MEIEVDFSERAGQTVPIRNRVWADECTDQQPVDTQLVSLPSPNPSIPLCFFLHKPLWSFLFVPLVFPPNIPISPVQSPNAFVLHPIMCTILSRQHPRDSHPCAVPPTSPAVMVSLAAPLPFALLVPVFAQLHLDAWGLQGENHWLCD